MRAQNPGVRDPDRPRPLYGARTGHSSALFGWSTVPAACWLSLCVRSCGRASPAPLGGAAARCTPSPSGGPCHRQGIVRPRALEQPGSRARGERFPAPCPGPLPISSSGSSRWGYSGWFDAVPVDDGLVLVMGDVEGHDSHAAALMQELPGRLLGRRRARRGIRPPSSHVLQTGSTGSTATCSPQLWSSTSTSVPALPQPRQPGTWLRLC